MTSADGMRRFFGGANVTTHRVRDEAVFARLKAAYTERTQNQPAQREPTTRRFIMRSPFARVTIAAGAVVAALLIWPAGPTGVTFADVIRPILDARTVVVDTIVGRDETAPAVHDVVRGSRIRRTASNMANVMIIDLDNGKMLTYDPETKGAAYIDIQGPLQEGTRDYLGLVREVVTRLDERPDLPVQELGEQKVDDRKAVGFRVNEENMTLTIWADPETRLPVRIEMLRGQLSLILKNIEFDVPIDDSLVSMEVPDGYAVYEGQLDMTNFSEEDFVETLRLWAELLLGGQFPETLRPEDLFEAPIDKEFGRLDLSPEEHMQLGTRLARGYMFLHVLAHGQGYTYVGSGARLGQVDKPIFWYRPEGSATCRVIYADLTVRDVTPENLPK